jgi:DNA-binding CsgD family transcriptional regulator
MTGYEGHTMQEIEADISARRLTRRDVVLLMGGCLGFGLLWFVRTFFSPAYLDGVADPALASQLLINLTPLLVAVFFFGRVGFSYTVFLVALGIQGCTWASMSFFPRLYGLFYLLDGFSLCVFTIMFVQFFCGYGSRVARVCLPSAFALAHVVAALMYLLPSFDTRRLHTILLTVSLVVLCVCVGYGRLTESPHDARQFPRSFVKRMRGLVVTVRALAKTRLDPRALSGCLRFGVGLVLFPFFLGISSPIGYLTGIYEGTPAFTAELICVLILQTLVILIVLRSPELPNPDVLLAATLLAILSALLLIPFTYRFAGNIANVVASTTIKVGYVLYLAVVWVLLARKAHERPERGIFFFGAALFANAFFMTLGTQVGNALVAQPLATFDAMTRIASVCIWLALMVLLSFSALLLRRNQVGRDEKKRIPLPSSLSLRDLEKRSAQLAAQHGLTPRESQVVIELIHGKSLSAIGESLYISTNTVRTHVHRLYAKLDVHNRQELLDLLETDKAPSPVTELRTQPTP